MDWSLYRCGRAGHITYAPDEADFKEHLGARTATGELWRCLRCGSYVTGEPSSAGRAADAPVIRRGKEIRSDIILRLFAIERFGRFLLFSAFAYGIWRFARSRLTIAEVFKHDLPIVQSAARQLGFNVSNSSVITLIRHILHLSESGLTLIAVALSALAVISLVEGTGLWLAKRWGEYFAMVATSLFVPVEVYELYERFTVTKILLLLLNLTLVVYLVLNRRLFGARGGKEAYDARLRSESVFDEAATVIATTSGPPTSAIAASATLQVTRPYPTPGTPVAPDSPPATTGASAVGAAGPGAEPDEAPAAAMTPPVSVVSDLSTQGATKPRPTSGTP